MGFWDFLNSMTDAVKRNSPDLTPVTKELKESLPQLPGPEDREKIVQALTQTAAHPAAKELLNLIPGGAQGYNIVRALLNDQRQAQSVQDEKKYEHLREEIKKLQEQNERNNMLLERILKELESTKKVKLDSTVAQKPEELLRSSL